MKQGIHALRQSGGKRLVTLIGLISIGGALAATTPAAKVWLFKDPKEMQLVVPAYSHNPRATYYVIMRAYHQALAGEACVAYHDLLQKNNYDPDLQAAYAFSHFMATGALAQNYFKQQASPLTAKLRQQQMEAQYYREEAVKEKPKCPEVLLETALPLLFEPGQRIQAVDDLKKAAHLAPRWAEAHYWLGYSLDRLWADRWSQATNKKAEELKQLEREAIKEFQKAEQLQPALYPDCVRGYSEAYQSLDQPKEALKYLDEYIKLRPDYGKKTWVMERHTRLEREAKSR